MKFEVTEEYIDALCPSGENDHTVRTEIIEARSWEQAQALYRQRHHVDRNNSLQCRPVWKYVKINRNDGTEWVCREISTGIVKRASEWPDVTTDNTDTSLG